MPPQVQPRAAHRPGQRRARPQHPEVAHAAVGEPRAVRRVGPPAQHVRVLPRVDVDRVAPGVRRPPRRAGRVTAVERRGVVGPHRPRVGPRHARAAAAVVPLDRVDPRGWRSRPGTPPGTPCAPWRPPTTPRRASRGAPDRRSPSSRSAGCAAATARPGSRVRTSAARRPGSPASPPAGRRRGPRPDGQGGWTSGPGGPGAALCCSRQQAGPVPPGGGPSPRAVRPAPPPPGRPLPGTGRACLPPHGRR